MTKKTGVPAAHSQVVERTCLILREIVNYGHSGARLIDLTNSTKLSRPTVHRLLQSLIKEKFVEQKESRRYFLGIAMFEISLSAPNPFKNIEPFRQIIQELADLCGDTVYLSLRRGDLAFYLLRCEGEFPIRTHIVNKGETLPLVGSHGGHALLSVMKKTEVNEIIKRAKQIPERFGAGGPEVLYREIEKFKINGYSWATDITIEGVAGIAAPVPNPIGQSHLAVSISGISARLDKNRERSLSKLLIKTAQKISEVIYGSVKQTAC